MLNTIITKQKRVAIGYISFLLSFCIVCTAHAQQPELKVQIGHAAPVLAIDYSTDGKLMVSGSEDYSIKLWDAPSGKEIMTFQGHQATVQDVAFSPDGNLLASGSSDGTLKLWEVASGKNIRTFYAHLTGVNAVAWLPDGNLVFTAGNDGFVRAWDLLGREKGMIEAHQGAVNALACNPSGEFLVSAGTDKNIQLIQVNPFKINKGFAAHTQAVNALAFSTDGTKFASAGADRMVKIWNASGGLVHVLFGHAAAVNAIAIDRASEYLFSGANDGSIVMWDFKTGTRLKAMEGHRLPVYAVKTGVRSDLVASGSADCTITTWNVITGKEFQRFKSYAASLTHVVYAPDGNLLAFSGAVGDVYVWDMRKGKLMHHLKGHNGKVNQVAFSPDGLFLATASDDEHILLWNLASGRRVRVFRGHHGAVNSITFHPNGKMLLSGGNDQTIRSWETATGKPIRTFFGHLGSINALEVDSAGNYLASGSDDKSARIWDIDTGRQILLLEGHGKPINDVSFSPLGNHLATASNDETIRIWDAITGQPLQELIGTGSPILSVSYNRDGSLLVSGSQNHLVQVWKTDKLARPRLFFGHKGAVKGVAFSPSNEHIVSVSDDQQLKVWRMEDGAELISVLPSIDNREFVLTSLDGWFDGTEKGIDESLYFVQGTHVIPLSSFYEKYYTPGLWGKEILGEALPEEPEAKLVEFSLPPEVYFTSPKRKANTVPFKYTERGLLSDTAQIQVTIEAYDEGGGIDEIQLFQNGKLVVATDSTFKSPANEGTYKEITFDVTLVEGTNKFTAIALNNQRTESIPDFLDIAYKAFIVPKSELYVLTIGIDQYKNKRYNLNYAKSDAKAIETQIVKGGQSIFKKVHQKSIYDAGATAESIRLAFADIIAQAKEEDVFVFFYAGHGVMSGNVKRRDYYLCPHDITKLYGNDRMLRTKGISATELKQLCTRVKAQKQLILLDACQSGGAATSFAQRGVANEKAIVQLARSTGIALLAASDSEQFAAEVEELGHGVFTYSILQALSGKADSGSGDKKITVGELRVFVEQHIPEISERHKGVAQYPTVYTSGQDFPISVIE